ncbi:aldo/keto reductase [Paenibacillus sp. 598K]|uniref:aldo/keto reductase n=1 Tax=Paenibacillus sp. 598K TaxID=1117987 RepID=UPI000FFEF556|nr:aldo/keto reductase [Paenibacillus sp. 598K]
MTMIPLKRRGVDASRLVLGCMPFGGGWNSDPITEAHYSEGQAAVEAALEAGINMFDLADIYTRGKSERVFGEVLRRQPGLRERIVLQSKCGIVLEEPGVPNHFDFSPDHILRSVDGSLQRLGVEYLDILLLHRPDPLMDAEQVGEALRRLKASGKVRHFGVSNMSMGQIKLLQTYSDEPFIVNQLEMSLSRTGFVNTQVYVNQDKGKDNIFPEGTMEYCQLENIQLQAWGPLAQGRFSGRSLEEESEAIRQTAGLVGQFAEEKGTTREAIVLAWLLKHPAGIQPVIGTTKPERIAACRDAERVELSRIEWYLLYNSSRGLPLPKSQ